jgi:glutathione S-transferase
MKLYRFKYSPYARKVQMLLELMGQPHQVVEASYGDRDELATLTGGYIHVPVLVEDDGTVLTESRAICEHLVKRPRGAPLVPAPWQGPIWAFHDFVDGPLEDVLFRIATPAIRDRWPRPGERALYTLIKERKFGAGCVEAWHRDRGQLIAKAKHLLAPTLETLAARRFLFGDAPTLADCSLYGNCMMLEEGDPALLAEVAEPLVAYARRVEAAAR